VTGDIRGLGDEHVITRIRSRFVKVRNSDEFLSDSTNNVESRLKFSFRVVSFNNSGDNGNIETLLADLMDIGGKENEDIRLSTNLSLGNDQLKGSALRTVRERVVEDTDTSDNLSSSLDLVGSITGLDHVAGMADDHLALGDFITTLDS